MNYFQGVVVDYLRADRTVFLNTECSIQLNPGLNPDTSGPHWYCDAIAVNHREQTIYLCEITYAKSMGALQKRLGGWSKHWEGVTTALMRDRSLPGWPVRPWVLYQNRWSQLLRRRSTRSTPSPGKTRCRARG
jgi:hypothetical protein